MARKEHDVGQGRPCKIASPVYSSVLFLAYWFGSSRFDADADSDFDPEDVDAFLRDRSVLLRNLQRRRRAPRAPAEGAPRTIGKRTAREAHGRATGDAQLGDVDSDRRSQDAGGDIPPADLTTRQLAPSFVLLECAVVALLWLIFAGVRVSSDGADFLTVRAGLDSFADQSTDLRFAGDACQDYRPEAYRWLSYQFTHVGFVHMLINVLLCIIFGVPLEGAHGHLRMFVVFNAGVVGGALCNMVVDQHTVVVGCSGGCYSLIGIHLADLYVSWSRKKFRLPTLLVICALIAADLLFNAGASNVQSVSHAAHLGGGIAGVLMGVAFLVDSRAARFDKFLMRAARFSALFWLVFSLAWLFAQDTGPRSVWEAMEGEAGWCWHRAMLDHQLVPLEWRCVRCGLASCIQRWLEFNASESLIIGEPALSAYPHRQCEQMGWWDVGP